MRLHRFIGPFEIDADWLLLRDPDLIHQIRTVLKLKIGEQAILADGAGREARVRLAVIDRAAIEAEVLERRTSWQPARKVTLYCSVLKREHFEYAVQKAVETGAALIVPVITARTVKLGLNPDRLAKIAKEAAEQSGRGDVPEVAEPLSLTAAMKAAAAEGANYFFDRHGRDLAAVKPTAATVGVWIGPEGGWEEGEAKVAADRGFQIVSLGETTLRAETAATVAVYFAAR